MRRVELIFQHDHKIVEEINQNNLLKHGIQTCEEPILASNTLYGNILIESSGGTAPPPSK